ncbi:MAG TPA: phosphotransferase [Candidatus Hydrogenedentes bacterium]|nr:phosphotransferase [Candidatus Hydrogenedentota bacterium]
MVGQIYASHFLEVARRHGLPVADAELMATQPCSHSLSQAVFRPARGWCVKLLAPGSPEGEKLPAERAILGIIENVLTVPKLLGHGITEVRPVRIYHVYEWVEGSLWKKAVAEMNPEDRLRLLRQAGAQLGKLHAIPPPEPDVDGNVTRYPSDHFREMCRAFETGYEEQRGLRIDWTVMRAHALLQWVKRCVNSHERKPAVSRSLAGSVRIAVSLNL